MGYRNELPTGTAEKLEERLKSTKDAEELRRVQAVYYRARYGYLPTKIAEMTGYSVGTIHNIHSKYIARGDEIFVSGQSGGRNAAYMSKEEEAVFMEQFIERGDIGGILEVSPIHKAHCKLLGKEIPLSTTYRLLHRHGWRKIEPRPRHPKSNKDAQADFKKMA